MPGPPSEGSGSAPGTGQLVAQWPLSLSPFVPFISGSPGGPQGGGGPTLPITPLPRCHFNAPKVASCCCVEGGGGPGVPRATADSDKHRRLTRAP